MGRHKQNKEINKWKTYKMFLVSCLCCKISGLKKRGEGAEKKKMVKFDDGENIEMIKKDENEEIV